MTEKRILNLILLAFLLLGTLYALTTPVFEASDELWHYPLVEHLAQGNPLPVQVFDPAQAGPWNQEASQPPLYYYLAAALTFPINTDDMEQVRRLNPHVDNGIVTDDGNINLVVHDPALSPTEGTLLAVRIIRLFSILLATTAVYLTYRIARLAVPERPELVLGATAVHAFLPMYLFISGSVNNDNLVIPLISLTLWLLIWVVKGPAPGAAGRLNRWFLHDGRPNLPFWLCLGTVLGLAALSKITAIGLLPLLWGTILVVKWQEAKQSAEPLPWSTWLTLLGRSFLTLAIVLFPASLIAGWWYYRNIQLYGDWSGWNAFIAVLGQRADPATLAQLWDERWGFMLSFWGLFGGVNVPMATWLYHLLNGAAILAVPGFIFYLGRRVYRWWQERQGTWSGDPLSLLMAWVVEHFALVVALLWLTAVVLGLVRWATVTWSSQGRLVFSALSAISLLFVLGLAGWLPRKAATGVVIGLAGLLFGSSLMAPFLWIGPAYQPPQQTELPRQLSGAEFGERLRLESFAISETTLQPGQTVEVTLVWQVTGSMSRDWSVFVHLNDPIVETPVAQRDMYPGQGLLATSFLEVGQQVLNRYHLRLPDTAVAPAELDLVVGLYDFTTDERLETETGQDTVHLADIVVEPAPGELPNPVSVNFENQLELVGYTIQPRRAEAGQTLDLVLYWRPLHTLTVDYTFFAQVVAEDTTRWASHDLAQVTSNWPLEEVQTVNLSLPLDPDTPPAIYPIIIGLYTRPTDGSFDNLKIVTADGRLTDDLLRLTQIRVD